jgi:hypothetical protein
MFLRFNLLKGFTMQRPITEKTVIITDIYWYTSKAKRYAIDMITLQ